MTATTIKSDLVLAVEKGTVGSTTERSYGQLKTLIDQDVIPTTSTDEADDAMMFGPIPSGARIISIKALRDDIESAGDALTIDVGLAYSGLDGQQLSDKGKVSATIIDRDLFANELTTFRTAGTSYAELRFNNSDITTVTQTVDELAGVTTGGSFYVSLQVGTAGGTEAQGDVVLRIDYI